MTLSDLTSKENNFGEGLVICVDMALDCTYAHITVYDNEGSYVANDTISDAELTALKSDLCNAEFDTF